MTYENINNITDNDFLNMTGKEIKLLIKEGIIKLTNLN